MGVDGVTIGGVLRKDSLSAGVYRGEGRDSFSAGCAAGQLRQELVDHLGRDEARAIVARAGLRCGRNDAAELKSRRQGPCGQDWLQDVMRRHYLAGMVDVRLDAVETDGSAGPIRVAGDWINSREAEDHLRQHDPAGRPVCWSLEGYSTGFATEIFDREIVCIETSCRGKGDLRCSFELRPASDWGPAAFPALEALTAVRIPGQATRCLGSITQKGCVLQRNSLDAILTIDSEGVITSCSPAGGDLLGLQPDEAVGRKASSFCAGGSPEVRKILDGIRREGHIRGYYTEIISPEGRRTPIVLAASAVQTLSGNLAGIVVVAHNLSEIRKLEDELASQNRFMANILQDSADGIVTVDPDNYIRSWNKGAEAIFGYTAEEMVGRHIDLLIPEELRESRELERIVDKMRTQGAVRSYQTERITKDGRRIQVIFTRTAIRDDSGKIIGSSAVLKDVTSYRNLERQLGDAEHLATLGELSAGLAHEIKNPLAGIKGAIEVIRDSLPSTDVHGEVLGDVLYEVNRIDKIMRELLGYAKPKAPSHSSICLPEMAQRIIALFRQSNKSDSVTLRLEGLTDIPEFTGDESQLEQVLLNLLLNAQGAVSPGGRIDVRLAYDRNEQVLRLVVADDGKGIPEELQKRIFQPFFTTRTDGTGLGLATCLKNVQYHGGAIEVHSEVGKGATFTITIPMVCRI